MSSEWSKSSHIAETGEIYISLDTIDNLVGNEPVSLIKMDIEGSELKALQGAAETIKNNKPTLAICVYHKPEDLITIPQFIKSIYDGYRFYLRHHDVTLDELVLYAIPE